MFLGKVCVICELFLALPVYIGVVGLAWCLVVAWKRSNFEHVMVLGV